MYSLTGWLLSVYTISGQVFPVLLEWVPVGTWWCGFLTWKVFYCLTGSLVHLPFLSCLCVYNTCFPLTSIVFLPKFHTFRLIWITLLLSIHAEKHGAVSWAFVQAVQPGWAILLFLPLPPSTDSLPFPSTLVSYFCTYSTPLAVSWQSWVDGRAYSECGSFPQFNMWSDTRWGKWKWR